jgi:hypothetical protein
MGTVTVTAGNCGHSIESTVIFSLASGRNNISATLVDELSTVTLADEAIIATPLSGIGQQQQAPTTTETEQGIACGAMSSTSSTSKGSLILPISSSSFESSTGLQFRSTSDADQPTLPTSRSILFQTLFVTSTSLETIKSTEIYTSMVYATVLETAWISIDPSATPQSPITLSPSSSFEVSSPTVFQTLVVTFTSTSIDIIKSTDFQTSVVHETLRQTSVQFLTSQLQMSTQIAYETVTETVQVTSPTELSISTIYKTLTETSFEVTTSLVLQKSSSMPIITETFTQWEVVTSMEMQTAFFHSTILETSTELITSVIFISSVISDPQASSAQSVTTQSSPITDTLTLSSTAATSASALPSSTSLPSGNYKSLGCVPDYGPPGTRVLENWGTSSNSMSTDMCALICEGYVYFGTEGQIGT